jgi:DNA-directed RNA polymerase subunit RPC12/RpoP
MLQATAQRALAVNMAVMTNPEDERVRCEECGSDEVYRLVRQGFFQGKIFPLLGFYPWRCKRCGLRLMMRKRGVAREQDIKLGDTQERKTLRAKKSTLAGRSAKRRMK